MRITLIKGGSDDVRITEPTLNRMGFISKGKVKEAINISINKWNLKYSVTNEEIEEDLLKELGLK